MDGPAGASAEVGRIKWFFFLRLVITISCIGIVLIYKTGGHQELSELQGAYGLLVFSCCLNVIYLFLLQYAAFHKRLPPTIVWVDLFLTAALTYLTGAALSWFVLFYFATIVAASLIVSPWSSIGAATGAALLSFAVTAWYFGRTQWFWPLPYVSPVWVDRISGVDVRQLVATVAAQAVAYHMVGFLSGMLASSLSRVRLYSEEILENMGEGAIVVDNEGRVAFLNSRAREILGLSPYRQIRGMRSTDVLSSERYGPLLQMLQSRPERYLEMDFRTPSGRKIPLAVASSVLREDSGRVRGVVVMLIDLTLRKRAEEAERRAAGLEAAGQLAAGIAHEIRNPLASIRGAAQELKASKTSDSSDAKLMELVIRESDRLNDIITDFLIFARAKPSRRSRCEIGEELKSTVFLLQRRPEARHHPVELELEGNLVCLGDPEQLRQVFLNLGVNAMEASGNNQSPIRIRACRALGTSLRDDGRPGIAVEFIDSGRGVAPGLMAKVFEPFFTTKPKGTGLGLSIVQRIVQNHDGDVQITSNGDGGTIVSIWLPEYRSARRRV